MNVTDKLIGEYQKRMDDEMSNMTEEEIQQQQKDMHISDLLDENPELADIIIELEIEKQRYHEALEFYANKDNWKVNVVDQWEPIIKAHEDEGLIAFETLMEGDEG